MGYDIETLRNINQRYCGHPHILTNSDVEMVNNWISKIQQERMGEPKVTPGDLVQLTTRYGDYYGRALVNSVEEDGQVYVCEQPYTPFVYVDSYGKVGMNASGGAWSYIHKSQMRYVGKGNVSSVIGVFAARVQMVPLILRRKLMCGSIRRKILCMATTQPKIMSATMFRLCKKKKMEVHITTLYATMVAQAIMHSEQRRNISHG